jgi:hypothetical protein
MPALFEYFPQAAVDASLFILNHLYHFIVEMLHGELINKIIPSLKEEIELVGATNANTDDGYNLLCHYMAKALPLAKLYDSPMLGVLFSI